MAELLLDSLEIKNYRCFEHLTVEKLGRVNLIVGKNNVGKTAFLEILKIWAEVDETSKAKDVLDEILYLRDEKAIKPNSATIAFTPVDNFSYRHLIYNRPSVNSDEDRTPSFFLRTGIYPLGDIFGIPISITKNYAHLDNEFTRENIRFHSEIKNFFYSTKGLDEKVAIQIWDDILIQNEEDEAIKALKIILENIEDLDFINYPRGSEKRVPVVRVKSFKERIPLKSFGEGMFRLLGIALALFHCRNGLLLIDEIENGLHYSILTEVWKKIFQLAKELNVQVFATTHSKDCIEAFTQAAIDDEESKGMLIRLERRGEQIIAKTIEEERLADAINYGVEVR